MLDDFAMRAALAGLGVALAAAPLGCFVVWRRMAYFGDATSHAALLGVALALATDLPVVGGVLLVALMMALIISTLTERNVSTDALLGVLAHSALALGLVAVSLIPGQRVDLSAYLFGDILAVRQVDLAIIWIGAALVGGLMVWRWQALLTATLNPDLAVASGGHPKREQLVLTLALAVTVAVAIKVVGALLIAAMLVIPAAAARPFARTPEVMAICAVLIGGFSALGGLAGSFAFDTPTGPSIVTVAAAVFALSAAISPLLRRR
ncbi:metal ABC transporter permease [Sulfitobacter mediterraneus]|uniref:High-affinity zinc uptake system membrane protein ZnuB n=1 Tax=Sulfitobacter mediterraneus TaxID=83219 RepID=A0A061SUL5_9RHOB|nr:metal ABC transporter permease [Sulfitobacter mediterraneus]KAJ03159.1 membrane protein [Sulfitobacter mediterraneus]MBM1309847.1 metal ABC transporter permease [Sulfitobacter mediterraneus]MBM1313732.1 metal ABC transporter permease [Sulfitobacter mediterraneus]MBM1322116.1 metal ABC transporter permease [Sulfitobacter mediterraneus]MBM1326003.1 metal ABC transporter permease [Sulfitobacter mediterraneus]